MSELTTSDLRAREHETIDAIRKVDPARVTRPVPPDPEVIMGRVGITSLPADRPRGYLRLFPQDFIVEEILPDGNVVSLAKDPVFEDAEDRRTLWADMVKAGISGFHAVHDTQELLGLGEGQMGYAGMKDAVAITAQRVTLRGVTVEQALALPHDRIRFRPVRYGSGALQPGDLRGNRFTIVVRGDGGEIDETMTRLQEKGFFNFYGAQRFGTRLNAQRMGQKLLQNDPEGVLRLYFGDPGIFDVPLYHDMRLALAESYGDWSAMLEVAKHFPFTLRDEIRVLEALQRDPKKTRAALSLIKDQVKIWVYAYTSWLINRRLSAFMESGETPPKDLELPLTPDGPPEAYRAFMDADGTSSYRDAMPFYPYLQVSNKTVPSRIVPSGLRWERTSFGWVTRFELGKGAYATTLLSHAFKLYEGLPVPDWVQGDPIDSFAVLGEPSIQTWYDTFAPILKRRDQQEEDEEAKD